MLRLLHTVLLVCIGLAIRSELVVNAQSLTPSTRGALDQCFIDNMRHGACFICVRRAATTGTNAPVAAPGSEKLADAGIDVTHPDTSPDDHPLRWSLPDVIITPHSSAASPRSVTYTWIIARENLRRYTHGEKLPNLVDRTRGY